MGRFEGTVMAVTGAAQGIGRRVAERAAAEGAKVAVIDRSTLGADVAREIGNGASFIEADLETWDGAALAMARAAETFGRI
ncbi:MAG: SDR family NAD(P)-dependent oxidoreductase, partial [Rubrimonas sp.]